MLKFSLLIPIYNGEKYLDRLFTSLLSQDIPQSEYEIVCVDDCSKDSSVEMVLRYQKNNPNVRLIINEKNRRLATNVNTLIDNAKGEYIWVIGQDDYIAPNCLGKLISRLERENLDVLVFNYRRVNEDESTQAECKVVTVSSKQRGVDWIKQQFADKDYCRYILGYEWRAVYRREYWKAKNIRCVDGMMYEDTIIMLKAIVLSDAVASVDDMLYNYRINTSSITFGKNFVKRGDLIYEFAFGVGQEVEDFYNQLKDIDETLATTLYAHLLARYNNFTFDLVRTPNEHKRVFYQRIKQHRAYVDSKRQYINWKAKLLLNCILGYPIAYICYYGYWTYKRCKK